MKLQTQIPLRPSQNPISYTSKILLIGSCFSEHIGRKFEYYKFQSLQNPFGILFHPKAIENLISKSIRQKSYSEKDIFFHNERWHCFDAHSDLSNPSKEKLLQELNSGLESTNKQIRESTHIMITLGTAWVYRHIEESRIVSNCHKIPQKEFKKELLSVTEVSDCLSKIVKAINSVNRDVQIIFTISPVRHLKDGFVENQQSKAHLITAIHNLMSFRAESRNTAYFPSYEIMMDELRDYRFYEQDMVHPNQLAIDCIWEKFQEVWISKSATVMMEKVSEVQKGLQHRPFNPNSEQHQKFIQALEEKITYFKKEYPFIVF